jgi:peptidoglycan/LPS O-acetylase OafA/YrhL
VTATLEPGARQSGGAQDGDGAQAPQDGTPAGPRHDLPVLEAYRGIASLMVVVTHVGFASGAGVTGTWAGWLSRLDFGVALFFLLSGFLLFRPFVQAAYGYRPPVKVYDYLRRRYVRLYPAFILTLIGVYFLLPASRDKPDSLWIQTFFMVQNYFTSFGQQLDGLVQTWSLVIEVSFYVTLPLIALVVLGRGQRMARVGVPPEQPSTPLSRKAARYRAKRERKRTGKRRKLSSMLTLPPHLQPYRPLIALGLLFAGSLAWRIGFMVTSEGYGRELLWLPAFIDWFVAGMALAWVRERPAPVPEALRYLANTPGVCLCMALALYWLTTTKLGGPYDLVGATTGEGVFKHFTYAVTAALLMLPGVLGDPTANWRRHAVTPVMRWLGQISYGVFLWHPLLMELIRDALNYPVFGGGFWVTLILTTISSLIVATLSWRFLEEPAQRRFRNGFRRNAARAPKEKSALTRTRWGSRLIPRLKGRRTPAEKAADQEPVSTPAG